MGFSRRTLKLFQGRLLYSQYLHGISALDCPDGVNPALLWLWSKMEAKRGKCMKKLYTTTLCQEELPQHQVQYMVD
ncbi:hypothetical protein CapIbe_021292 [Capra ibex]